MRTRIFLLLASCLLLVVLPYNFLRPIRANTASSNEIVFLTVEIVDNVVHLLEWTTVPGTLKTTRVPNSTKGISYVASSATGTPVWQETVEDPRILRLEYPDPGTIGGIASTVIIQDTATLTVRIPARTDISRLEFFTSPSSSGLPLNKASARASMGVVDWPRARQGRLR